MGDEYAKNEGKRLIKAKKQLGDQCQDSTTLSRGAAEALPPSVTRAKMLNVRQQREIFHTSAVKLLYLAC